MHQCDILTSKLERAMRLYHAIAYTEDLRPAQWQALRHFATAPAGERTVSGLARARASTMGTTSVTVTSLVNRGFLERAWSERNVGLRLTDKGKRYLEESDPAKRLSTAISSLAADEWEALDAALAHIIGSLEPVANGEPLVRHRDPA